MKATEGGFYHFKERTNISYHKTQEEQGEEDLAVVSLWVEKKYSCIVKFPAPVVFNGLMLIKLACTTEETKDYTMLQQYD